MKNNNSVNKDAPKSVTKNSNSVSKASKKTTLKANNLSAQ